MSYRLIDSNDLAITYPEVNDMPCIYADLSHELDGKHYDLRDTDEVRAENATLRELVRDMMHAWWACDNEVCPRHDERCEKGKYCAFDECARELGIEVDG